MDLRVPFRSIENALSFIAARKEGRPHPPLEYLKRQEILSLPDLHRLAGLWSRASRLCQDDGLLQMATELSRWIAPCLQKKAFHALWCKEGEYQELEPVFDRKNFSRNLHPDLSLHCSDRLSVLSTLIGNGTSLGMVQGGDVEIRAFGPQAPPLSESTGFGIYRVSESISQIDRWTVVAADPEIWIDVTEDFKEVSYRVDLHFLSLRNPLYFVFYVAAEKAAVGVELFQPNSLQRYKGAVQPVAFNGQMQILVENESMQLIPLAGDRSFWGCGFLLAYALPLDNEKFSFEIRSLE